MEALILLAAVLASIVLQWVEATVAGRPKLRRYVVRHGYSLEQAAWRPGIVVRTAVFKVTLGQSDGPPLTGKAYVGGPWTGPVFSSRVEVRVHESNLNGS